jgi:hypothetical protein
MLNNYTSQGTHTCTLAMPFLEVPGTLMSARDKWRKQSPIWLNIRSPIREHELFQMLFLHSFLWVWPFPKCLTYVTYQACTGMHSLTLRNQSEKFVFRWFHCVNITACTYINLVGAGQHLMLPLGVGGWGYCWCHRAHCFPVSF